MSKFLKLKNGDVLRKDNITAIRLGDKTEAKGKHDCYNNQDWRVIVDFGDKVYHKCCVVLCDTREQRDELAARYLAEIEQD